MPKFPILFIFLISCNSSFDSAIWKAHNTIDEINNPRWDMVNDLQKILKSNEKEIIQLLGEPYEIVEFEGSKTFYYPVGCKSGFGIDPDFLVITIDTSGNIIDTQKEQH